MKTRRRDLLRRAVQSSYLQIEPKTQFLFIMSTRSVNNIIVPEMANEFDFIVVGGNCAANISIT